MELQRILVPIDGSAIAGRALDFAIERARISGAEITIAYVVNRVSIEIAVANPYGYVDPTPMLTAMDAEAAAVLQAGESRVKQAGVTSKTVELDGFPAPAIRSYARDAKADMIVMGTHGRSGFDRLAIGSTAEDVIRSSNIPVFALPQRDVAPIEPGPLARILVAVDGSPAADAALTFACEVARAERAHLLLCSVVESARERADAKVLENEVEERITRLLERDRARASSCGVEVETQILHGSAAIEILARAKSGSIDLIVIGTHGRAGIPRFILGSIAEGVLRSSSLPVCTVCHH
jgi:nucleotide-binding universal stress UspA family protein